MEIITKNWVDNQLPERSVDGHKGDYGRVLLLCGSTGFTGAAALSARGALRAGSGLIFLGVPSAVYPIVATKLDEPIVFPLPSDEAGRFSLEALPEILKRVATCDACLIGCGMGQSSTMLEFVTAILEHSTAPVVLDADGLNAVAGHLDVLKKATCPVIVTPHEGEFTRLTGGKFGTGRLQSSEDFARETCTILVRKGHKTLVTDGKTTYQNTTGNVGMATGGSGDVLAGIIVSLIGQGIEPLTATAMAVHLHGLAGDVVAGKLGQYGMTPSDMIGELPYLLK